MGGARGRTRVLARAQDLGAEVSDYAGKYFRFVASRMLQCNNHMHVKEVAALIQEVGEEFPPLLSLLGAQLQSVCVLS